MAENKKSDDPDIHTNLDNIREDISRLRNDLTDLSKHVKESGRGYAKSTTDKIVGSIDKELEKLGEDKDKVIAKIRDELEKVQESGRRGVETMESKIQDNPFKSILLAFIVGLFLGKLSDRK